MSLFDDNENYLVSQSDFAKEIEVSRNVVYKAIQNGRLIKSVEIVHGTPMLWREKALKEWERNSTQPKKTLKKKKKKDKEGDFGNQDYDFHYERAKKEHFDAKLKDIQYQKETEILIERDKVEGVFKEAASRLKTKLREIPHKLSYDLSLCKNPNTITNMLEEAIDDSIKELVYAATV